MNRYITRTLEAGEEIVFHGHLHWTATLTYTLWGCALMTAGVALPLAALALDWPAWCLWGGVGLCIAACCALLAGSVVRSRTEFVVTRTRLIQKDGILSVTMTEIPLYKIETVTLHQTVAQRMMQSGTLSLIGSGGTIHTLRRIANPLDARRAVAMALKEGQPQP